MYTLPNYTLLYRHTALKKKNKNIFLFHLPSDTLELEHTVCRRLYSYPAAISFAERNQKMAMNVLSK